jgi:hypothetical protein
LVSCAYVTFSFIDYHCRPQSRLINFFEAICTVGGVAVKANQEMILRLTWMNEEARESAYLVTRECTVGEVASKIEPSLPALPKIKLPSGDFTDGKITKVAPSVLSPLITRLLL